MLGMFASRTRTRNEGTNNIPGILDEPNYLGKLIHRADIDKQTFDNNYDQNNIFFQRAIADCSNLLALQPQEPKHIYHRSLYYFQLGKYDEALIDFKTILSSEHHTFEQKKTTLLKITKIYSMRMEWDTALRTAESFAATMQNEIKTIRYKFDGTLSGRPIPDALMNSYIEALEIWIRLNITANKIPGAFVGLNVLLNEKPNHLDALIMRHDLCKKQGIQWTPMSRQRSL